MKKKFLAIFSMLVVISLGAASYFYFDPFGNLATTDTTTPIVNIKSPTNRIYADRVSLFEISVEDDHSIDTIWYNWREENVTYVSPYYITFEEGLNTIQAWANDSAGNIGTDSVSFTVDINDPSIDIQHPVDTYYQDQIQLLEIAVMDDIEIDKIWYNWNGMDIFYESPINVTFTEGLNVIDVSANDTAGNTFQDTVSFTIADVFISVWDTTLTTTFSTSINKIKLPLESSGTYNFSILWGDGSSDHILTWDQPEVIHAYERVGEYEVKIMGTLNGWVSSNTGDRNKLTEIKNWGPLYLGNSGGYFAGCNNLVITAQDMLNLDGTTNLASAFSECEEMESVFNMNNWDVSNVTDMRWMFGNAKKFNQEIHSWDVSNVTTMSWMFGGTPSFNKTLNDWDVSKVTDMSYMFQLSSFNQTLNSWDVSNVIDMEYMFYGAAYFNNNISSWNVSSVTNMQGMFMEAVNFNQTLSNWNVSSVTNMYAMFSHADNFNQNISSWNVSSVTTMDDMFLEIALSTPNYDSLLIEWAKLTLQSGVIFTAGTSQYSAGTATTKRGEIIGTYSWSISDGGQIT